MVRILLSSVFVLSFSLSATARADGADCGSSHSDYRDISDISAFVHKTADYYEGSPRKLLESMSPREQDRYAATGRIKCPLGEGTAQLTVRNDIITTAAHALFDLKTCKSGGDIKNCKFIVKSSRGAIEVPIQEIMGIGFKCPEEVPIKSEKDWVVLKLKFPLDGLKPYEIDENRAANLQEGDRIVMIGHSMDFGGNLANKNRTLARHYGTCNVDHVYGKYIPRVFSAPCACAEGCSGGGALTEGDSPSIFGIMVGNIESPAELDTAIKRGRPNIFHADPKTRDSYFVPMNGDFLKTLKQAAEGRDI